MDKDTIDVLGFGIVGIFIYFVMLIMYGLCMFGLIYAGFWCFKHFFM